MHISLPEDVKFIIRTINEAGYEAYAVGGCVRDRLLNKEPDDYDITTSATPDVVKRLFRRTIDTGIEHGTVTVMLGGNGYEVTTYRIDGKYEDNRHPSSVSFTRSLNEDLLRRDFTINAMAYNDEDGLVDPFGGEKDLEDGIIRCVGNPMERFSEDALRIMRAVRFSAQLGYEIEEETKIAMKALAENLKDVSAERIHTELVKLLCSKHPENIRIAYELGLTKIFMPEFDQMMETPQNHPHHLYSVGEHTIKSMELIEADRILRLSMLFHDIGKPQVKTTDKNGRDHFHGHQQVSADIAVNILKRLKFDNKSIRMIRILCLYHDNRADAEGPGVRHEINEVGEELYPLLLKVRRADILAQSTFMREEKLSRVDGYEKIYNEAVEKNYCLSMKSLNISGRILLEIGYPNSPVLGEELKILLNRVLDDPNLNTPDRLLELARKDMNEA